MAKKKPRAWTYVPPKAAVPEGLRAELERKAGELIETVLKPKHIKPPPENTNFNYLIDLSTRWRGAYFYFVSTYACPGPNAISPTFETNFARLQHVGLGRFNLAFMRHTGKWVELQNGTLDECLKSIREDPWFIP
ncbi:hypothetical protein FTUN_4905 [Frigoriglobus tundricola]|uniref:Uncharacterized protein n=2 Tax=Frigoriglobus tundricola TaxID=2774151 RepID=A0A6M5YTD8_9BACT|nr:hypothetical protein FTUN_4905 [Frigoriglobus tundricola]